LRIVFFGASDLGYQCCERLLEMGEDVVGIFTIPQEFRISYSSTPVRNVTYRSFHELGERFGVPVVEVTGRMGDEMYLDALRAWQPEFGLVIGWYYMVPRRMREIFPLGVAGIHASLLPRYRGGAPLVWAIIRGETRTGVSLFYFDDGVDTGDLIAQKAFEIAPDDTIRTVYEKATSASLEVVEEFVPLVRAGTAPRIQQNEGDATVFPQRKPEDGLIDWSRSAEEIRDFIRAQTRPYPGAFTYIEGKKVTIWDADVLEPPPPGTDEAGPVGREEEA
jgi:methionyl-tRNA formyltransferase